MRLGKGRAKNGLLAKCFAHPNGFMICRELCLNKFLKLGPRKETPVPWLHASFLIGNLVHSHRRLWQKTGYLFWILRSSEILCGCFVSYEQDFPHSISRGPFTRRKLCLKSVSQEMKTPPKYFTAKDTSWCGSDNTCECTLSVKRMEKPQSLRGYSVYRHRDLHNVFRKGTTISTKSWVVKKWL